MKKTPVNKPQKNSVETHDWMTRTLGLKSLRIQEMILPGTHNSGVDKEAYYTSSNSTCQDVSPYKQLLAGIRVFDLRTKYNDDASGDSDRAFKITHAIDSGRDIKQDILKAIVDFRANTGSKDIIILDLHTFEDFNDARYQKLTDLIIKTLGREHLIYRAEHYLSVEQLMALGKNVLIAYGHESRPPEFWEKVNQRYIGELTPSTDELKAFMDKVAKEVRPDTELRSIQCAKYNKLFYTPDDFSDKVDSWFNSDDNFSYIQKFTIINTDWSTRSSIVSNCIHANKMRTRGGASMPNANTLSQSIIPSGHERFFFSLADGYWCEEIFLPDNVPDNAFISIISTATLNSVVRGANTAYGDDFLLRKNTFVVFNYQKAMQSWIRVWPTFTPDGAGDDKIPSPTEEHKFLFCTFNYSNNPDTPHLPQQAPEGSVIHTNASELAGNLNITLPDGSTYPLKAGADLIFKMISGVWKLQPLLDRGLLVLSVSGSSLTVPSIANFKYARPEGNVSGLVAKSPFVGPVYLASSWDFPYTAFTFLLANENDDSDGGFCVLRGRRSIGGSATTFMHSNETGSGGSTLFAELLFDPVENLHFLIDGSAPSKKTYVAKVNLTACDLNNTEWRVPLKLLVRVSPYI